MWKATAEEKMHCSECHHRIPADTNCLSQLPSALPEGTRRRRFKNFCINCSECESKGKEASCYVRWLSHWYAREERAPGNLHCGQCNFDIPEGMRTYMQAFYTWPDNYDAEDEAEAWETTEARPSSGFKAALADSAKSSAGGWDSLSYATQRKFMRGGLGGRRGMRSPKIAQRHYHRTIPRFIRNMGEDAVLMYRKGLDVSHIKSVHNRPDLAKAPHNAILEESSLNHARGARNMSSSELKAAKSVLRLRKLSVRAKTAFRSGLRGDMLLLFWKESSQGLRT